MGIILGAALIILAVGVVLWMVRGFSFNKEKAMDKMNEDWKEISLVTDFLIQTDQTLVVLERGDGIKYSRHEISGGEIFPNNDTAEYTAAKHLVLKRKYKAITKHKNYVKFLMWTRFTDVGKGIVYSIDGRKPDVQYLTKLEPLDRPGWYYYESDFNEWKSQNRGQGNGSPVS